MTAYTGGSMLWVVYTWGGILGLFCAGALLMGLCIWAQWSRRARRGRFVSVVALAACLVLVGSQSVYRWEAPADYIENARTMCERVSC